MSFIGAAGVLQGLGEARVLLQQELRLRHDRIGRALRERLRPVPPWPDPAELEIPLTALRWRGPSNRLVGEQDCDH